MLSNNVFDTIIEPIYSEKCTMQSELSKYTFKVAKNSTKLSIKKVIKELFAVEVVSVNILNQVGKKKVFKGKEGKRQGYKKAIVTLAKGNTIELNKGI